MGIESISVFENAGKGNVQFHLSEKIIPLKNCSVTTEELEDAKKRKLDSCVRKRQKIKCANSYEKIIRSENSSISMSFL